MVIVGEWRKRDDRTQRAAVLALVGRPAGAHLAEYFVVDSCADRNEAEVPISSIQVALLLVPPELRRVSAELRLPWYSEAYFPVSTSPSLARIKRSASA